MPGGRRAALLGCVATALLAGFAARLAGTPELADFFFALGALPVLAGLLLDIAAGLRRGEFGLDLIAALAIAGALALGEALAGAVVALMYAGGEFLEDYARRRARREMTALLARQPRTALRHGAAGIETVALDAIRPGDLLLIRRGAVLPVDGVVAHGAVLLDESALTGEPLPVRRAAGESAMSGSTNAGEAFDLRASDTAERSSYAAILRLVEAAQASKAPVARLAERWALGLLLITVLLAGGAWLATGDALRALAVLVVATPCPLILAVPVAVIAGISRAARIGVLMKSGDALEALTAARVLVLDKTGTLTIGQARLAAVLPLGGFAGDEVLRLAASLDQASSHVLAAALCQAARERGLALDTPRATREDPGAGIAGEVGLRHVMLGGVAFVAAATGARAPAETGEGGAARVAVAVDGVLAGLLVFEDPLRADAALMLRALRAAGIARVVMASGDAEAPVEALRAMLGLEAAFPRCTPAGKVAIVESERRHGPVMMLGDGVNDAPALAAADIGVAMGARGAAASSQAADIVLLVDRLDRLADAMAVARRAMRIARQSAGAGIALSFAGMIAGALGAITAVQGAVMQEAIDVAVILNALRALRPGREGAIKA